MDLIPIVKVLSERRLLVALSMVAAIAVGVLMVYKISLFPPNFQSKQYAVGAAVQNVLIDTPRSSAADLNPPGSSTAGASSTLENQAVLLANLMLSARIESSIAGQLGIPLSQLSVTNSATTGLPVISTELATTVASTLPPSRAYDLTIIANVGLPVLTFETQAPTPQRADALAAAATTALRQYIDTDATTQGIPQSQLTVVTPLGPPQYGSAQRGPKKLYALVAVLLTMVMLCALIVVVTETRRRLRSPREAGWDWLDSDAAWTTPAGASLSDTTNGELAQDGASNVVRTSSPTPVNGADTPSGNHDAAPAAVLARASTPSASTTPWRTTDPNADHSDDPSGRTPLFGPPGVRVWVDSR